MAESLPQLYRMAAARRRRRCGWLVRSLQTLRVAVWGGKEDWAEMQRELIEETER